jgi:polygalacturonase
MNGKNITDFGAIADKKTLCTVAIHQAISACEIEGGGTVFVPAGHYLTGSILMKSHINLHLDAGAVLVFSNDKVDYPMIHSRWEGAEQASHASCVYGKDLENISITGSGTLDGNGVFWWELVKKKKNQFPRPKLVTFEACRNIKIEGITLVNSPSWTVHPIRCKNVKLNGLTIINPKDSPNTDGINPESCQNVHISNCHINVGDDCIAIKSGTEEAQARIPCENIVITNCTMIHGHGGVVIGSEMSGDIRHVTISNCVFEGTDRGIRFKSRRGRGGVVEDIRVSNIIMKHVFCPFVINLYYYCGLKGKDQYVWDKNPYPITEKTPTFRRIHFANVTAREVKAAAGFMYGLAENFIEAVTFDQISIHLTLESEPELPAMMAGIKPMTQRGFFCGNVQEIQFNQVTIENHQGPAFHMQNSKDVSYHNCKSKNAAEGAILIYEEQTQADES